LIEDAPKEVTPDREFAHTFFRPDRRIIRPNKKNSVSEDEMEKIELVDILTEVPRTKIKEGSASEALVKQLLEEKSDISDVIIVINTTEEIVTTPTPVTANTTPVSTTAPVTTKPPVTTSTPVETTPKINSIEKKAPISTRILGTPRFVQIGSGKPIPVPNSSVTPSTPPVTSSPERASATQRTPKAISSGEPLKGNYEWEGKRYLLTWRTGRNNFEWSSGLRHCEGQGMRLVSLDTKEKAEHFLSLVEKDRAPYFWSGGQVSRDSRSLTWLNGVTEAVRRGQHPWSFTGRTGPQPDGGETCVAILNNVYRDGVKFHDVACHHRKPVVCEE